VLSVPGAARLLASALVGRLPQGMSSLAILLLVRGDTGSYAAAGFAVGAYAFLSAAGSPLQGRLIDRFGRARVLAPCAFGQAAVLVVLVLLAGAGAGAPVLIVLSGLAGALLPPIAPSVRALLREVFEDAAVRDTAYALDSVIQEVIWTTGPLVVAVMVAVASPTGAVLVGGAVCALGTTLFVRAPLARQARPDRDRPRPPSALASPELRALLVPALLSGSAIGAIEVGLPSLALHAGSRPASGLLLAVWSIGSMIGGLGYGAVTWRNSLASRYRGLLVVGIVCSAPLIAARSIPAGLACSLLSGLTIAPVFSCMYALVSRVVVPGAETEAFTWMSAALVGGIAAGSAIGGAAIAQAGESAPFVIASAASTLAAACALGLGARVQQPV
jgi:MFS family permease